LEESKKLLGWRQQLERREHPRQRKQLEQKELRLRKLHESGKYQRLKEQLGYMRHPEQQREQKREQQVKYFELLGPRKQKFPGQQWKQ
jgi:hypothetical protein